MTSASIKGITTILVLTAALIVPAALAAPAAEPEPYLVEYRAYNAALESGYIETAAMHGLAAWEAAEQALGDHRLTGILAYNYGQLIVFSATEQAAAPLRRASDLRQAGVVELPPEALRLYLSYAEFAASGFEEGPADDLREILNAVGLENEALIADVAPMWLTLASQDVNSREYRKAVKSAAKAEIALGKANPDSTSKLIDAILLGAIARLAITPREIEDLEAVTEQFARASHLFPPQEDIDSFDPLFAQVLAWHHAAWGALTNMYESEGREPPDPEDDGPSVPSHTFKVDESLECGVPEWEERGAPHYPRGALRGGYLGAVMIGYRVGEDLKVHDARVLAEVPSGERFGKASLAAVSDWRIKSLPSDEPGCYQNMSVFIKFIIES